jgi:hypothetical protein
MRFKLFLCTIFIAIFVFSLPSSANAQVVDLRDYIAGVDFVPHSLSTGESVYFTGDGGSGPGTAVRQYKNSNYEQFFIGNTIYRREDTSWAPLPGFGDAQCANGNKAIYFLDPGCSQYSEGQSISSDGARWGPFSPTVSVGETWTQQTHQIVTIDSGALPNLSYCSLSNLGGYSYPQACNQAPSLQFVAYYSPGEYTFCTGLTNEEPLIALSGTAGAGAGDQFLYMRGWGLVGFEAPGFQAGLMGEGADPSGCSGGGGLIPSYSIPPLPPGNPPRPAVPEVPIPYTPCSQIQDEEFHSLRPYPASPCNDFVQSTVLMCANTFTAREVFEVTPEQATFCEQLTPTSQRCQYDVQSTVNVSIWPALSRLPIMGNTELVPNSQNANSQLSSAVRVNEYASWYLNGVTSRAEEEDELLNSIPLSEADRQNRISEVINFSGPLKKLLPLNVQNGLYELPGEVVPLPQLVYPGLRTQQQFDAEASVNNNAGIRHNQIAVCATAIGTYPVACYNHGRRDPVDNLRLTDIDPLVPTGGGTGGVLNPFTFGLDPLYSFIPFSSTEDLFGMTRYSYIEASGSVGSISVSASLPTDPNSLSFPHMVEVDELANSLQKTFTSLDFLESQPTQEGSVWRNVEYGDPPMDEYFEQLNSEDCELMPTRKNPGDLLYGVVNNPGQPNDNPAQDGTLQYNASFECVFETPPPDQACMDFCTLTLGLPTDICASDNCAAPPPICQQYVDLRMRVTSATPRANNIWDRLVAGDYAIFRRMFPRVEEGAPIERIRDIPAEDTIRYDAFNESFSPPGVLQGTGAIAGDAGGLRPGYQAKLYFPHIGSVHEYFLQQIQCALRPQGNQFCKPAQDRSSTPVGSGGSIVADCSPETMEAAFGTEQALNASCIAGAESNCRADALNNSCLRVGGTWDYSVGLFQINLIKHPWRPDKSPQGLQDAMEAAGYPRNTMCYDGFSAEGVAVGGFMKEPCVIGDQTIIDICTEYFSNPQNNVEYTASILRDLPSFGWSWWGTAGSCGL